MAKRKQNNTSSRARNGFNDPNGHIDKFLQYFEQEHPLIRDEIANMLPAYNALLSIHARTFEEFSLMAIAKERGLDYTYEGFSYKDVRPTCAKCGSADRVRRVGKNRYACRACNRNFSLNPNSICSDTNLPAVTWMRVLQCLLDNYTISKTCRCCHIARDTYYNIRAKLFYAMQIMMEDVKLYGLVECDNTEVHLSYKGIDLTDDEYPEDCVFDTVNLIPRPARKRGGPYPNAEKNVNSVHMYAAIDNYGHCTIRCLGIGSATAMRLERAVPASRYLKEVPDQDPFPLAAKTPQINLYDSKKTLIVSDKESAIAKYVAKLEIPHEAHVFNRNGHPAKLPEGSHNIQRVNALHQRFKTFFRKSNYFSSRYLPGYLVFFEFLENTEASPAAIGRLFEILVTPGLGKTKEFYEKLYTVPDAYTEWAADNVALQKIPYKQLLTAFMYHEKKAAEAAGKDPEYTVQDIMEATGYQTAAAIRRIYKNMVSVKLMDDICKAFADPRAITDKKIRVPLSVEVPENILQYYDEFCSILQSAEGAHTSFKEVHEILGKKYGLNMSHGLFMYYVKRIEGCGMRGTSLAEIKADATKRRKAIPNPRWEEVFTTYSAIVREYELSGKTPPKRSELLRMVGERVGLSQYTVADYMAAAKNQRRKDYKNAEHGRKRNENDS